MRSCCAAYVDVGYLLAAAATRVTGSSLRRGVQTEYDALIAALIAQVEADSGLPLLRVNWYDAGSRPGGMPDATQDEIGALPRVKLRLGRLSYSGEQKGVDVRIGLDLAIQAQHRVADVAYLVSGDDDLTEAVEEAQGRGVQVVLLAVADHDGRPLAVSRHLIRAADRVLLIDPQAIDRTIKSMAIPEGLRAALAGDTEPTDDEPTDDRPTDDGPTGRPTGGAPSDRPCAEGIAAAGDVAGARDMAGAGAGDQPAAGTVQPGAGAAPAGDAPRVRRRSRTHGGAAARTATDQPPAPDTDPSPPAAESPAPPPGPPSPALLARRKATELVLPGTTGAAMGSGTPQPAPHPADELTPEVVDDVAKRVVAAWCSSATPPALLELRERKPAIPAELDRALLVDLAGRGWGDDLDDEVRHAVRDRFWYHVARIRMA
ncbi:MAG: NYN domain-containing protein [Actinobacteria bacterium]|nr:NYN domain-containing protein [Actinomycetota bacterium]